MQTPKITNSLKVAINRIPIPTAALVGRTKELAQIKNAFAETETAIVTIVAGAGVGKSALTWEWLQKMQPDYGEAKLVFGWSFYSQGSHHTANSSTAFFQEALPFFGFPGKLPRDEIEKARALAECLRKKRSLLILDGLEPLQHPAHIMDGELADVAIKELLRCVQHYGLSGEKNLVLISSRQPLVELEHWQGQQKLDLENLTVTDGVKLLQNLGCNGSLANLQTASRDMGGHALALVLMGRLLKERFGGRIESRDQLPVLFEIDKEGGHALRVLRYYDEVYWQKANFFKWIYQKLFGEVPERVFLELLGLFDRPMGLLEKQVLFAKARLAKPLAKLSEEELQQVEKRLEQAGLLLQCEGKRQEWDTHPLIRSYFGSTLQDKQLYRQAQLVLFEYYQSVPDKHQPDTLEELEPLYQAVVHGCLAGKHNKALNDVYSKRILRGEESYSSSQLGAYAHDLTALAAFFPAGWNKPILTSSKFRTWLVKRADLNTIEPIDSLPFFLRKRYTRLGNWAFLLGDASFCLMYLGRLAEAVVPRQLDIKIRENLQDWEEAGKSVEHLVVLYLSIGQLQKSKQFSQQAIEYAYKTDNLFRQMNSRTILAATLYRQGDLAVALEQFKAAEKIQDERQPHYPWLYSSSGFNYCALLLDRATNTAARKAVLERGQYALEISSRDNWLLATALDNLTIARSQTSKNSKLNLFNQAVQKMRKAGSVIYIPKVLLARADFHCQQQNFKAAQLDLDESFDIINRCGMELYQVDALLLQANLNLDQNQPAEFKLIKDLITTTGYHLRDPELDLLTARIALYHQDRDKAQHYLQQSRQKLEKMGYWGLLPKWNKLNKSLN